MNDIVVLIPVYNPDKKIMTKFINDLKKEFNNIILINDGCNPSFNEYLNNFNLPILKHEVNLGKGRGIKDGINYILTNYKSKSLVVADCDGQHSVKDIIKCSIKSLENPGYLVLGVRDFKDKTVPFKSKFGNIITRNILKFYTGINISDTQTGLRAMSMDVAKSLLDVPGERFEYEMNCLLKKDLKIKEVPIKTIYINNNATSHFNPIKDSLKVYKIFMPYIITSLIIYIIENILLFNILNIYNILISLLITKLVSCILTYIFNKHINILYTILNYILVSLIFILIPSNYILIKILIELIMFIVYIL